MQQPISEQAARRYAAVAADPAGLLVGLDFDGTLAPIVDDPTRAEAHPDALEVIAELVGRVRLVAVVTGRPAAQVIRLGRLEELADRIGQPDEGDQPGQGGEVRVLGQYGHERWSSRDRRVVSPEPPPGLAALRAELPGLLAELGCGDAWVEDKGLALAVHTRRLPDPAGAFARLLPVLGRHAQQHGLGVEPGRMVVELRAPGSDKGQAVRELVADTGARSVLFAGDDLGDVPAFEAVADLRAEGVPGLLVCSGSEEQAALAELADVVVDGPSGVLGFLRRLTGDLTR